MNRLISISLILMCLAALIQTVRCHFEEHLVAKAWATIATQNAVILKQNGAIEELQSQFEAAQLNGYSAGLLGWCSGQLGRPGKEWQATLDRLYPGVREKALAAIRPFVIQTNLPVTTNMSNFIRVIPMRARPVKRERWITIGTVTYGFSVIGNCGFPGVMSVAWRGRYVWCAPWQFLKGVELEEAVPTRLRYYGLEAVAMATVIQERWPGSGRELRVLVRRGPKSRIRHLTPALSPIEAERVTENGD